MWQALITWLAVDLGFVFGNYECAIFLQSHGMTTEWTHKVFGTHTSECKVPVLWVALTMSWYLTLELCEQVPGWVLEAI